MTCKRNASAIWGPGGAVLPFLRRVGEVGDGPRGDIYDVNLLVQRLKCEKAKRLPSGDQAGPHDSYPLTFG